MDNPNARDENMARHEARFQRVTASPFFGQRLGKHGPQRDFEEREGAAEAMRPLSPDEFAILMGALAGLATVVAIAAYKLAPAVWALILAGVHAAGWL